MSPVVDPSAGLVRVGTVGGVVSSVTLVVFDPVFEAASVTHTRTVFAPFVRSAAWTSVVVVDGEVE